MQDFYDINNYSSRRRSRLGNIAAGALMLAVLLASSFNFDYESGTRPSSSQYKQADQTGGYKLSPADFVFPSPTPDNRPPEERYKGARFLSLSRPHKIAAGDNLWKYYVAEGKPGSFEVYVNSVIGLNPGKVGTKGEIKDGDTLMLPDVNWDEKVGK